jgi:hypothetical protein
MPDKMEAKPSRPLSPKKSDGIKEKGTKHKVRNLSCQAHDLTNQLSVINLCCFKLRALLIGKLDEHQLKELAAIEIAAAEAAKLLDEFRRSLLDPSTSNGGERLAPGSVGPSSAGRFYPTLPGVKPRDKTVLSST